MLRLSSFNKKYKRVEHLFQDRYKSEVVTEDSYVPALARYIHQNPLKAVMVKESYTGTCFGRKV